MVTIRASRRARARNVHSGASRGWMAGEPRGTALISYLARSSSGDEGPAGGVPKPPRHHAETVLLAEDDDAVRKIVARMLENAGFIVLTASSAAMAEQLARDYAGPIHLLLTDVVMPEGSGRELMERLQSRYPSMRVLYMSGYTDDVINRHGVQHTGMTFIPKPFTRAELTRRIREILDV